MTSESNTTDIKPLAEMSRDELRKVAAELKIAGRGTMLKPALIEAIAHERAARIKANVNARKMNEEIEAQVSLYADAAVIEDAKGMDVSALQPIDPRPESPSEIMSDIRERAYATPAVQRGERGMVNGRPMPTYYCGRAMGAKHYPSAWGKPGQPNESGQARPVGYDSREDVYVKQRGSWNLTPKQERRLTHKANHHSAVMADPR